MISENQTKEKSNRILDIIMIISFLFLGTVLIISLYGYRSELNELLNEDKITSLTQSTSSSSGWTSSVFPSKQCHGVKLEDLERGRIIHATGSMRPTIYSEDVVLTTSYDPSKELVLGDIVMTSNVIHRVSGIKYCGWNSSNGETSDKTCIDYLLLKGDNNHKNDNTRYYASDVKSVVCGVLRGTTK